MESQCRLSSTNVSKVKVNPGANVIKLFYGRNLRMAKISWSVNTGKSFQPSLMFASNARAYTIEAPLSCLPRGQAPSLTLKHQTRLVRDKHSCIFGLFINNGFITLPSEVNLIKPTFCVIDGPVIQARLFVSLQAFKAQANACVLVSKATKRVL